MSLTLRMVLKIRRKCTGNTYTHIKYVRPDHIFSFVNMELFEKHDTAFTQLLPGWPSPPIPPPPQPLTSLTKWGSAPSLGTQPEKETSQNSRLAALTTGQLEPNSWRRRAGGSQRPDGRLQVERDSGNASFPRGFESTLRDGVEWLWGGRHFEVQQFPLIIASFTSLNSPSNLGRKELSPPLHRRGNGGSGGLDALCS